MAFTVVLLSELNAIEAHLYQKVLPQRVVDNQPEVLQQRLLPKSVMSSYDARYKADQKKSVKCVYFTKWPPHAYCNVLSTNRHKRLSEAENDCRSLKVALTNMATTPMYRICRLIRLFGIEDQRIWVEDILYQPDTISWEDCFFWVENETTPPAECGTCNVSVICQAGYYYPNGPRCGSPASYNYKRCSADRVTFNKTSASEICAKHNHSLLSGKTFYSFHPIPKPKPKNYWDASAEPNWNTHVKTCAALNFDFPTGVLHLIRTNCSKKLQYIYWNSVQSTLRPICVRNVASNYPESIEECGKLGMELIPSGLERLEYMNIVNYYFLRYMVPRPRSALWVNMPHRVKKDSCPIMSDWKNFTFDYADCTQNIGSTLCLFTNKERHSAAGSTTN